LGEQGQAEFGRVHHQSLAWQRLPHGPAARSARWAVATAFSPDLPGMEWFLHLALREGVSDERRMPLAAIEH